MAKLQTVATATTEVVLEPALKAKLKQRLAKYAKLDAEFEKAKAALDKEAELIEGYFEQADAKSITLDGIAVITRVDGQTTKSLDKKLFVQQGGTLAQLENATVSKPKKAYVLITLAKE